LNRALGPDTLEVWLMLRERRMLRLFATGRCAHRGRTLARAPATDGRRVRTSQNPPPRQGIGPNRVEIETPSAALAVASLIGEHDLADCELLEQALHLAATRRRHLIIDLSRCEFIDSTGVALLLHAQGEVVSAGGRFAIVVPSHGTPVARVAEVLHFAALFPVFATLEAAQAAVTKPVILSGVAARPSEIWPPAGPDYFVLQ
jgi:anti-sigma B factor antagonist